LYKNEDFKKILVEGYFRVEASRTVLLKADPNMQTQEEQKNCDNVILAIGHLYQYFAKIFALGTMSKNAIDQDRQTREEMLAEAGNDDTELTVVRAGSLQ
jgi:transketolase N-terminal domain/subunit